MKSFLFLLITCFTFTVWINVNAQTIYYVKENGTGNGTSWVNASANIQDMIDRATAGSQIWIAKGIYYPTFESDVGDIRSKTINLKDGVHLYGGFAGNETSLTARAKSDMDSNGKIEEWEFTNETILSGDIGVIGDDSDNVYRILYCRSLFNQNTNLDGFTVTKANGARKVLGGGIFAMGKVNISNCIFSHNSAGSGGGIYSKDGGTINNCYVYLNRASNTSSLVLVATVAHGGGIYKSDGSISNCIVANNSASASSFINYNCLSYGGGIYNNKGSIEKCIIKDNSTNTSSSYTGRTYSYGGGIYNDEGTVSNSCISGNWCNASYDQLGSGIYNIGWSSRYSYVFCCTLVGNALYSRGNGYDFAYNCILNLDENSLKDDFVASSKQDYRLKAGSKFIDAGNSSNLPSWILTGADLSGNSRIYNGRIDVGAYEYVGDNTSLLDIAEPQMISCYVDNNGIVHIEKMEASSIIQLWDINGRELHRISTTSSSEQFSLPQKGIYIINIQSSTSKSVFAKKIVW